MFKTLIKNNPKLFFEFTKNEKILKQYLSSNDNNFYKAFKSFISKYAKKEMKTTASFYIGMLAGIKTIQEGMSLYKKHLQEIGVKTENINKRIEIVKNNKQDINDFKKIVILKDTLNDISLSVDSIIIKKNITEEEVYNKYMEELISETDNMLIK